MAHAIEAAVRLMARAAQEAPPEGEEPLGPPPDFVWPEYSDDYEYPYSSLQHAGFFILFFFPCLAVIAVVLRMYVRIKMKQLGWGTCIRFTRETTSFAYGESTADARNPCRRLFHPFGHGKLFSRNTTNSHDTRCG